MGKPSSGHVLSIRIGQVARRENFYHARCIFYYKFMPFGLKNIGATYHRTITKIFDPIIGKNMDAYIDDIVVNSKRELDHVRDLAKVFKILRKHKLRLNTAKCAFEVSPEKFLGHMVTRQGIKTNLE